VVLTTVLHSSSHVVEQGFVDVIVLVGEQFELVPGTRVINVMAQLGALQLTVALFGQLVGVTTFVCV